MKWVCFIFLAFCLTGCGLIPKPVEFGQDKVKAFPRHPIAQLEAERQAVALAADRAREAEDLADGTPAAKPAGEAAELSEAVSRSLGPPSDPWKKEAEKLVVRLDSLTAKYNRLLDRFKEQNDENAGKKIEGTGWLQIPYMLWLGIIGAIVLIIWNVLKALTNVAAAGNPGIAVGMKVAQVGAKAVSRGFSQVIQGGEKYKQWVVNRFKGESDLQKEILEHFRANHEKAQDEDVKILVKELTK